MDSDSSSMDEEFLQEALVEQLTENEKRALHKYSLESLHHSEFITLVLEFKDIMKMDFIHDFTSLVRLDLNNNLIEKIWGLDHLTNLTWLNLSCNRIKNIEGLESLKKLELLNLAYNQISLLNNMDTLENLSHFFISKNLIRRTDTLLYLRRFKSLFKLSIAGNPLTEKDDRSLYVAAFFPNVTLLDNILIGQKMRDEAIIKYQIELKKFRPEELQAQNQDASVNNIVQSSFHSKVNDDTKATEPHCLPGVAQMPQTAESPIFELCSQIFPVDSAEHKQMEAELNSFFSGQIETETYYQQRASQILADFDKPDIQRRIEIKKLEDPELKKIKINKGSDEISQLCESLLNMEFELVGNLDCNIKLLESSISEIVFTSKDSASHNDLLETINETENQVTRVNDSKAALIKELQDKEEQRNRVRISDIHRYVDYLRKQLKDLD
ncbi:dynein regulatory complex subunit 3-like isoform X1 [Girardinichthys multiradiatus]|uniref:dynein regulatory complex subunit 3-like isoform X1 n=1 Tax=Girardinichthys multiradiatus TaxID=208333 RepID=UPI001FAD3CBB|nr:dynein regulatory complex subunit 3-like isoform X1 [Girardinichthys multiradiatus]XP_047215110.1 dynein regulatory complex subunit 3-like isoform X1 [Girardinichthys multiradiatus]XP_047215111.1 dynein regulatory complex subunit 3-like isoform X1 [Girardinichthys multiradiatus]XP_047215113.1 dynein regulatory complex subunit 3-like isoform X1 [Girardinichthys multiradiatus]